MTCRRIGVLLAYLATLTGCSDTNPASDYRRHFVNVLPRGVQLENSCEHRSGWSDMTYGFKFTIADGDQNEVKKQLVQAWHLEVTGGPEEPGVLDSLSLKWWPTPDARSKLERYHWEDFDEGKYRRLWIDQVNRIVYAEYGNW